MYPSLDDLFDLIGEWGKNKGITNPDNAVFQYLKFSEEGGELAAGIAKGNREKILDAIGDVFVTWVMMCKCLNVDPRSAVYDVYNIINARKGVTVDGVFVKEEDLVNKE